MIRADPEMAHALYLKHLNERLFDDAVVLEQTQSEALDLKRIGTPAWSPDLQKVKQCYSAGTLEPHIPYQRLSDEQHAMPLHIARAIASEPTSLPGALLGLVRIMVDAHLAQFFENVFPLTGRHYDFAQRPIRNPRLLKLAANHPKEAGIEGLLVAETTQENLLGLHALNRSCRC